MPGILTFALHHEGEINKNSLGAVSEAALLSNALGAECHAVVVGNDIADDVAASLGTYGATKVFRIKAPEGLAQPVVDAMAHLFEANGYDYALFGGGLIGFEVGAGLVARIDAGVTMEVTAVSIVDGRLEARRPIFGDSLISRSRFKDRGIVIARLNAFEVAERGSGPAEVVDVEITLSPHTQRARMVRRGEQRGADVDIEDADVIVAGGRGLGSAAGFELCEALATALGGAVAATRAVVDAGWYPYGAQIGQTGKTVAPKLYLAAGISGAIQHKVGMQSSENIVAINKDPNAPIFEFSDLGVVGDLAAILPKLTAAVQARKGIQRQEAQT
ncbi:MAG TPA: electron transfer flavoprotein subunit alpha/FixB family protein [Solirubrobacteraceae bacterium]|nr:electron transfer flavoprotein subunit alpha/FixB family protein [Solirubrobacteraceae bacterium]